ncbi:uncharacterized protein [Fopius arisanus]|uniref:GSM1 protein n=1 Tax=Fopius arisanus TaxID=64838 RepID=A0A0C9RRC4_9HYME|nr:PREDICTED: uncharacterized protein LOC105263384 [Fopius arisanus]
MAMDLPLIDVSICINIVTKIVSNLSQSITKKQSKRSKQYCHIDIELIPRGKYCWVQITNEGETKFSLEEVLTLDFNDSTLNGTILGEIILKKSRGTQEIPSVYKTYFDGNFIELRSNSENPGADKFSHLRDYLSVKIEHPFAGEGLGPLVEHLMEYLINLQSLHPHTKYTLRTDRTTFYNNFTDLDDDFTKCKILSSALEAIVSQSVNECFRKEICETLEIPDVSDTSTTIMCNLLPILHKNYQL